MSFLSSLISGLMNSGSSVNKSPPEIYLSCDGDKIQFPVDPSEFGVTVKNNNSTVNINSIGELNMLGKTGLKEMNISSFFPAQAYYFCQCTPNEPYEYIEKIENWRVSGKPCRFSVAGTPINYPVSIESFGWNVNDGTGDVNFSLQLREYKYIGNEVKNQVNEKTGLKERTNFIDEVKKNVTVYPGDSIGSVLGRAIGKSNIVDSSIYTDCYKLIVKGGGLNPGQILKFVNNKLKVDGKNV